MFLLIFKNKLKKKKLKEIFIFYCSGVRKPPYRQTLFSLLGYAVFVDRDGYIMRGELG